MKLLLEEMTRDEAGEAFGQGALVLLPTGSIEQHGPHLPLMVDTAVVTHVARAAGPRRPARCPWWLPLPCTFGVSHHHLAFAGTMSLTTGQYVDCVKELVRCLYRNGVRRVFLLNGHGGNQHPQRGRRARPGARGGPGADHRRGLLLDGGRAGPDRRRGQGCGAGLPPATREGSRPL